MPKLAYVDLFSGPGRYLSGAKSTPLLIIEHAISSPILAENLRTMFNDMDAHHTASLQSALEALPGYEAIRHPPKIFCDTIDSRIEDVFAHAKMAPTLSFIDPYGYKGLTATLIRAIGKDWGSDCIFFFNYRRINAAITNDNFRDHMDALFGRKRVEEMRTAVSDMRPWERVDYVLGMLTETLADQGFRYSLAFRFKDENGKRTTHALVYVTKNPKGYGIMKEIMAAESSSFSNGVPSFEHDPAGIARPQLDLKDPIQELASDLEIAFAGRRTTVGDLIDSHHLKTRFLPRNYRQAINEMERSGRLSADPPASCRRRGGKLTCGPKVVLTFPRKGTA